MRYLVIRMISAAALAAIAGLPLTSCTSTASGPPANEPAKASADPKQKSSAPPAATVPAPAPPDTGHALHNVHPISKNLISGAVPEGDAAFDELRAMGVKTIISVDGATPDVSRAQARGMRYVHIPITYAEANRDQQLEIARAVRDLPGPVFIHCHHGKHRSPTATAAAAILLGEITPQQGIEFMKLAGTAPTYEGLYACVAAATPVSSAELDAAPHDFPAVRTPKGVTAAMIEVDSAYENLTAIRAAGWKTPAGHPDLVPAAEAGRLADHLRFSAADHAANAERGDDYLKRLRDSVMHAAVLEEGLVRSAPAAELEASWKLVAASCKDCHVKYRDRK